MRQSLILSVALVCMISCGRRESTPAAPTPVPPLTVVPPSRFQASGVVVDIQGGPIADAIVSSVSCNPSPSYGNVFTQTLTDAQGKFLLTADSGSQLPIGCVFLSVKKDGYVTGYQSVRERAEGITIPLQPLRTVIGRVVAVEGPPVSDVKVLPGSTATFTDANGFFAKSGIGTYMSFGKPGYVDRFVLIPEGHDVDLGTIHIQPTIAVSSGSRLMSRISSEDVDYDLAWWGDFGPCSPCKRIELQSGQRDLDIQLRWWGTIPLQLWAASGSDGEMRSAKAAQGGSLLTLQVSATTSILFVGIQGMTGTSQAFPEPEAFELTTLAQ